MYILSIDLSYPNNYWLNYESTEPPCSSFANAEKIDIKKAVKYAPYGKVSEKKFLEYDFLYSPGTTNVISPRFASVLENDLRISKEIQLIEAEIIVNEKLFTGYKVINLLCKKSCIDLNKSIYKPLLSYLPDGPLDFEKIVLKNEMDSECSIFRDSKSMSYIIVSEHFKQICEKNNIKGLRFLKEYYPNQL